MKFKSILKILIVIVAILVVASIIILAFRKPAKREIIERRVGGKLSIKPSKKPVGKRLVEIIVLVDNYPNPKNKNLEVGWGLSILVKVGNHTLLFDTGPSGKLLEHNSRILGLNLSQVEAVVISHEHGDHVLGLEYIAKTKPKIKVYIPSKMRFYTKNWIRKLGVRIVEVENTTEILPGVYIIGQLYGPPWEQALAVNTSKGLIIIVGCSHPRVENVVAKALKDVGGRVYAVIGGFHMVGESPVVCEKTIVKLLRYNVTLIAPIHCSGDTIRRILESKYPEHYLKAYVGFTLKVDC